MNLNRRPPSKNSNKSSPKRNNTSTNSVSEYDEEGENDNIDFYYEVKTTQPHQPKWIFYLNTPDKQATIMGKWIYYFNDQQKDVIQQMTAGSQEIAIPLHQLEPDRENKIRVHFEGTIDG